MQRSRSRALRVLMLLLAFAMVASSCGGRDDDSGGGGGGGGGGDNGGENGDNGDGGEGGEGVFSIDTSECPDNDTAGISDDNVITLASSFPQSGLTAAFAQISKGYIAYFDKINAEGGVTIAGEQYTIEVEHKDDEYQSARTIQNIEELVGGQGDGAFAVFNVVGTANNIAIREDLQENCVPNLFAATGSSTWGNPEYPWLVGSTLAPYSIEAVAYADWLKENQPEAKVAMLIQDDDFGQAYEQAFRMAIEGSDITVTEVATYPTGTNEVATQVTSLRASGADAFFNGSTLLACPNGLTEAASINWERESTFVSGTCISKTLTGLAGPAADDILAVTNTMDPMNPEYADDPVMAEYLATLDEYAADDVDPENGIVAYGYTQAAIFVHVLENAESASRSAVLNSMRNIDSDGIGMLVPGVRLHMDANDPFLAEDVQMVQYNFVSADEGGFFENVGEVLDFEGRTAEITPEELINN